MLHSAVMTEPRRNVFAILDMGSTKMVCFAVKMNNGVPEIIGIGHKAADGINGGAITNMQHASYSVLSSIDLAEQIAEQTIDQVYINISGCGVSSFNVVNEINSTVHEISDRDIKRIVLQTYEKCCDNNVIVHNIPIAYHLDNVSSITELKGLYGSKLRADMHVVTASKLALLNIENCITNSNLSMAGCIVESYASGLACLTEDEKELGTVIVDIGGSYTSIGIFDKGKFVYADSVPLGGVHVTRDIAYGLYTSVKSAERIKILHGNIMLTSADKNYVIEAENDDYDGELISVMKSDLIGIIRPRIEEILELVKDKLEKQKNIVRKVVITGGCSQLTSMKEIASYVLNKQVRIGIPVSINGLDVEYTRNPIFSAAIGVTLLVAQTFYNGNYNNSKRISRFKRLFEWIK
ncbi:cell division protein FtsA [Neoehrlichia mikurensis]|uniref:Cell division protein FtsA n=1 Tax=Neoehrlichia mikurensis TaxID=89586 RepID=A0A9Q9BVP2_9RICK|nr:cell division protein FtsA [Neoehrlichia mikurensis]QXK91616.1 cell division protein FtsA [Neoehrlichia mikurensis]QXK92827.1 cell division protein FtsA [Neoehrlichia mikurensis]QXK93307.1 cell division protein FtsA [Neoehrlichia mikurensis]UTO55751.1 cell division protein FtsA [Neoehrlichia mikurensis]UTO56668.1 cell division protein FtsA [Neoehrlichia mikurensis]